MVFELRERRADSRTDKQTGPTGLLLTVYCDIALHNTENCDGINANWDLGLIVAGGVAGSCIEGQMTSIHSSRKKRHAKTLP